jgi:hypothetical protein
MIERAATRMAKIETAATKIANIETTTTIKMANVRKV